MIKKILIFLIAALALLVVLFAATIFIVHKKQDSIVQELLLKANEDFAGRIEMKDSHISFIEDFPYISIDLEQIKVWDNKTDSARKVVEIKDVFVGFDFWNVIAGKMEIGKIHVRDGRCDIIQNLDGSLNIMEAFKSVKPVESTSEEFHLDLYAIEIERLDIAKWREEDSLEVDLFIESGKSRLKSGPDKTEFGIDTKFEISLILAGDTTFINHKHFAFDTDIVFLNQTQQLIISQTTGKLEGAEFDINGSVVMNEDMILDLNFKGTKPNFDLFMAMAPVELVPVLKKYNNSGKIYFEASVKGASALGQQPAVNASFGCEHAFFENTDVHRKLDDLNFSGYFTNGADRAPSTMEFGIRDFSAKPEAGKFAGELVVKNFDEPDINLNLESDFELNFLAQFFNLTDLYDLNGKILLTMNFHDIIDLEKPERSIERLNESYFTQLKIENLSFGKSTFGFPVRDVNLYAEMDGHEAKINYFKAIAGNSDIDLKGTISDLPAIIHHTDEPVTVKLDIQSKLLDLFELSGADSLKSLNERIMDFSMAFHFNSSARSFTESPNLPIGEFFIDNLYAKLEHYPHTLHDFHADVFIEDEDFRIIDFKGIIDKSDFHFTGKLKHYDLWFEEHARGDTRAEFNLYSERLQFEDIFSYKGENYVPEDYRHEEFDKLHIHGVVDLHFNEGLQSIDLDLDRFDAKMKIHAMRFENFNGRIHYEKGNLAVEKFKGKIGHSDFAVTAAFFLGDDESGKSQENFVSLNSSTLDFDQLFQYHIPESKPVSPQDTVGVAYHDEGFNIYTVPFTDMTLNAEIGHLRYHKYMIDDLRLKAAFSKNHQIRIEELKMHAAEGDFVISGLLNAENPERIYLDPIINVSHVNLDMLFFKFDNFGQDYLISENLHGHLDGKLNGHIRIHKDFAPILAESEIHMDLAILNGRLEHFSMFDAMSDYFADKNLEIVSFDTLANHLDLINGILSVPEMTINSSIGFIRLSGSQDMDLNMEYFVRVPWKLVTGAASSKLFGRKKEEVNPEQIDAIQYESTEKRTRFLNLRIKGNTEDFEVTLSKDKKK
jgi:hypothetical protein